MLFWKKIKRKIQYKVPKTASTHPYLLGEQAENGKKAVVYVGNGATSQNYKNACDAMGGSYDQTAIFEFDGEEFPQIENEFSWDQAKCIGFYARRRESDGWSWYCVDGKWHPAEASMPQKKLWMENEQTDLLFADSTCSVVVLVAQWENANGIRCDCGYEMFSNTLMAHAFGGMDGKTYHNTEAAFNNGIQNGYRYFEVDLSYTKDKRLVLCHGWTKANCKHTGFDYQPDFADMTYKRIMGMKVHGNPIMDAREFYHQIKKKDNAYTYEIDFHNIAGKEIQERTSSMLEDFQYDKQVLDRLLIQAYSRQMFEDIHKVYPFVHYQYLVGKNIHDLDSIITYCLDHGICVLALRMNLAKPEYVRKIRNAGLYVMCYTVNKDLAVAQKLLDSGVNTLCTDFITEEMLNENSERMGHDLFYVYYNSGSKEVQNLYPEEVAENVEHLPSGNYELKDQSLWINDGKKALRKCGFRLDGKKFAGWKMRMQVDGKQLWYCKDHLYHGKGDIAEGTIVEPYLFADEEVLPVWTVKRECKMVMVAVWK